MSKPMAVEVDGRVWIVPRLTPQQILSILSEKYAVDRANLIEDLDDSGADHATRLQALSTLRRESDLVLTISRLPFSARWSRRLIEVAVGETPTLIDAMESEEIARIAFWTIGQDLDELASRADEGNSEATGT